MILRDVKQFAEGPTELRSDGAPESSQTPEIVLITTALYLLANPLI